MKHPYYFSGTQATGTITVLRDPSSLSVAPSITVAGVEYTYGVDFTGVGTLQVSESIASMLNGDTCKQVLHDSNQPIKTVWAVAYKDGVVRIVASSPGTGGNAITLSTDDSDTFTVSGATLSGGTDGSMSVSIPSTQEGIPVFTDGAFVTSVFTRPENTTGYTAADNISNNTTAGSAFTFLGNLLSKDAGSVIVTDAILSIDSTSVISGMSSFTVFFFNVAKTRDDNATASLSYSDMDGYLGKLVFPTPTDQGGVIVSFLQRENLQLVGATDADDIYTVVVTDGAWTPTSALSFKLALKVVF